LSLGVGGEGVAYDRSVSLDDLRPYLEADGICRDPIFIVGSPRSGTTALGHALNKHPDLWTSKEAYVLFRLFGNGRATGSWKHHWERSNPSWLREEEVERAEFLGFLGLGINAMYSSRSQGRRWVDPTPLNTLMIDDVAEMFPGAAFLNLVRDGRRVVRSMLGFRESIERERGPVPEGEMPPWTRDFEAACESWANHVEIVRRFEDANPRRCLTIRNEDLVEDPAATVARMLDFLGAGPDDGPAEFLATQRINSSFEDESHLSSDTDWGDWAPEQREAFARLAGFTLVAAGYATKAELEAWAGVTALPPR
jgi:Sulfotransferase family